MRHTKLLAILIALLIVPSVAGASLHFTLSSSDKVTITSAPSIETLTTGTVVGWFYLDSISNTRVGFVSKEATTGGWALQRVGADGSKFLWFCITSGTSPTIRSVTGTLTT